MAGKMLRLTNLGNGDICFDSSTRSASVFVLELGGLAANFFRFSFVFVGVVTWFCDTTSTET